MRVYRGADQAIRFLNLATLAINNTSEKTIRDTTCPTM
jgi:hypothetical protein